MSAQLRTFSNLAISLDGRIADARTPMRRLGTALDRKMMDVIRAQADVIVVGAQTLRVYPQPMRIKNLRAAKRKRQPANAVVSASGKLDAKSPFWSAPDVIRYVFTTEIGMPRAMDAAQDRAFVIAAGKRVVEPGELLKRLSESALHKVLIEGGGELMASFLEAELLQELYVTLTPWLIGGRENPSLVGGHGLSDWSNLKLKSMKKVAEEVYFHYLVRGAAQKLDLRAKKGI